VRSVFVFRVWIVAGLALIAWPARVSTDSSKASVRTQQEETIVVRTPGTAPAPAVARGTVLGQFEVPRLGLSYVLLEGTDSQTLNRSVGHVEGTGLPGSAGNIAIAGHRDRHFRKLEWIQRDDQILLTSREGAPFVYRVEWSRTFKPGDIQVLDESHGPAITLITCFPFEYVGSAPLRLIVRAVPDDSTRAKLIASPHVE
jgi:sortase A